MLNIGQAMALKAKALAATKRAINTAVRNTYGNNLEQVRQYGGRPLDIPRVSQLSQWFR